MLGRQREIAFVLAIFVIDDDHHPAGADVVKGAGDIGKGGLESARLFWHWETLPFLADCKRHGKERY